VELYLHFPYVFTGWCLVKDRDKFTDVGGLSPVRWVVLYKTEDDGL